MITRVWGVLNSSEVEFQRIPDRPDYWEAFAPKVPGLQDIEIWAENDRGAKAHLGYQVLVEWNAYTVARIILAPYVVTLIPR